MAVPGTTSITLTPRKLRLSSYGEETDGGVIMEKTNVDTGTPTFRIREGNVLIKRTSTGEYVEATDSNADTGTQASITSSGHTDANGTIKIVGSHGTISVTTSTGTGTEANHATDLNADATFTAHFIASSGSGELTIKSKAFGPEAWFYVHSDTMATCGFSEGVSNGVIGTDPDVVITLEKGDVQDESGTTIECAVRVARLGHFKQSQLINLTAEAQAVLRRRGCIFE